MAPNSPASLLDDGNGFQAVETTPLISQQPLETSKRVRSYTNTSNSLPKHRLRPKCRAAKLFDRAHIKTAEVVDGNDHHKPPTTPSSLTTTYYECRDSSDRQLCDVARPEPSTTSLPLASLVSNISLTLENSGSVARDHLASERTFLAYVRTSLALASSGVALVQLFTVASATYYSSPKHRLHMYIRPLGATTIVMGLIVLVIGVARYFSVQAALTKGNFPAARLVTGFIALALTLLVLLTFGILLAGKLEPKGPF